MEIIPLCDEELKPVVGRIYDSIYDFEKMYKTYAHHVGFSVRRATTKKDKNGEIKLKYFVCSKEGYKFEKHIMPVTEKEITVGRKRLITRQGCNAHVCVKRSEEGKYIVIIFHEGHNHDLCTPKKKQFLRSYRKVNDVQKSLLSTLERVNIGTTKAYSIIKEQVGGFENIGFTIKDAQNYFRDLKALLKDSDAQMFIHNFKLQQERDPSFYYAYALDNEDHLKQVFWSDGISRCNYSAFGDLLSFDTTYNTNKYSMIFAPFTGINNHRLSISFGAAFLADEKCDTSKPNEKDREVLYSLSNTTCTCQMFETQGIPCRHMILVWKGQAINELPTYCVTKRWTKSAKKEPVFDLNHTLNDCISEGERRRRLISAAWNHFSHCMDLAKENDETLVDLINNCLCWKENLKNTTERDIHISNICSSSDVRVPNKINIFPPNQSKTKGSGKRLKSGKEVAIESKLKKSRLCRACGEMGLHDSRNCQKKRDLKHDAEMR